LRLAEGYEQTMARIEQITRPGFLVKIQWKCQFDEAQIPEQKPELLAHRIVKHAPLITRDALYGGRTEAMRLHYEIREEDEPVQFCEVMSLYPYICKYFKFPIGHPIIHVGDACADKEASLKMDGLMKCTIVPPKNLYHPVLPSVIIRTPNKMKRKRYRGGVHIISEPEEKHYSFFFKRRCLNDNTSLPFGYINAE